MFRQFRLPFILLALSLSLSGCLTDHPLTESASTNLNTRLLGVFEYKERIKVENPDPDADEKFRIHRAAVVPRDDNTYWIFYRNYGEQPVRTLRFIGWISRVDSDYYLTVQDDTAGSKTFGKYMFVKFDWSWPGNIQISTPNLQDLESADSYELRQAVRSRLREGTLFPYESTPWDKIARIWWDRKSENPEADIPKEFETGREEKAPLL